jgi:hypothetical protein
MTRETRVRLSAAAAFVVVFSGGVAVGLAFDRGATNAELPSGSASAAESVREDDPAPSGYIIDQIEMDEAQRIQVDAVLRHGEKRMTELQKSFHPMWRAVVDSTNQSIRALLSPEQLARYDALEAERLQWRSRQNSKSTAPVEDTHGAQD